MRCPLTWPTYARAPCAAAAMRRGSCSRVTNAMYPFMRTAWASLAESRAIGFAAGVKISPWTRRGPPSAERKHLPPWARELHAQADHTRVSVIGLCTVVVARARAAADRGRGRPRIEGEGGGG